MEAMDLAKQVATEAAREIREERSYAWELIANARRESKRWFIVALVLAALWFSTIGVFVWYLNQYDFTATTTYTTQEAESGEYGNAIIGGGGDITVNGEGEADADGNHQGAE